MEIEIWTGQIQNEMLLSMTRSGYFLALIIILINFSGTTPSELGSGYEVAKRMFESTSQIEALTYTISKKERIEGAMTHQISQTKMQKSPYCVYLRQNFPNDGMEVLYVEGQYNNKALINPNGFPWLNLKLNPLDGIMRNDQHHTIFQSGFDHVVSILEFLCNKYQSQINEMVVYNGIVDQKGRVSHSISFNNPYFEIISYSVLKGENIEKIASKFKLSAYMILELNPDIKDMDDVFPGDIINIPNDYAPELHLAIDTIDWIPLKMEVYDKNGLFELYEYSGVTINPDLSTTDFSSRNEAYGF